MATSPTEKSDERNPVTKRLQDAVDDYLAKQLVDPAWTRFADGWATPVCENIATAAESISRLHDQWHQLIIGEPIKDLTGLMPLGDIAAELTFPGDGLFANTKLLMECAGVLFGALACEPVSTNACFKLLMHDLMLKAISSEIRDFFVDTPEPVHANTRNTLVQQMVKDGPSHAASYPPPGSQVTLDYGLTLIVNPPGHTHSITPDEHLDRSTKTKKKLTRQTMELQQLLAIQEQPQTTQTYRVYDLPPPDGTQQMQGQLNLPSPSGTHYPAYRDIGDD